jgi:hypothetical protein
MSYEFPAPSARHLVERLRERPPGAACRRWVLRDDNERQHHGIVRLDETPLCIELHWKADARAREQLVGVYRLHLPELLAADHVRYEKEGSPGGDVRLRFVRGDRGVVLIQSRADRPGLAVGTVDLAL